MNINEAYVFCEKVANKDQQGLLGPDTFNAFAPAAQLDAILARAPFYGAEEGITNELMPVIRSLNLAIPSDGIVAITKIPKFIRALSIVPATGEFNEKGECDLLPVDQFRKRATSASQKPTKEFAIATMNSRGLQVLPKDLGYTIFDYIEEPATPVWGYNLVNGTDYQYKESTSKHFVLPLSTHIEICARILVYAGLHLSNEQLQNWGLTRAGITSPRANG